MGVAAQRRLNSVQRHQGIVLEEIQKYSGLDLGEQARTHHLLEGRADEPLEPEHGGAWFARVAV